MFHTDLPFTILKVGTCLADPGNAASPSFAGIKLRMGIGGGSTVVLIRDGAERVLIDTGFDNEADRTAANMAQNTRLLAQALENEGLQFSDITKVFVTHFHRDHFGSIGNFNNAVWYCHINAMPECPPDMASRFTPVPEGDHLATHLQVLSTPGHTRGHASLVWTPPGKTIRIAVSGDAILNLAWLQSGRIWRFNADFYDNEAARESVQNLMNAADIIIPGHGEPFFSGLVKIRSCT